jgi:hypothetical protein
MHDDKSQHPLLTSFSNDGEINHQQPDLEEVILSSSRINRLSQSRQSGILIVSWCICLASMALNAFLVYMQYRSSNTQTAFAPTVPLSSFMGQSAYTGLALDTPSMHYHHTDYWSENNTKSDELWEKIDTDPMVVALTDDFADTHDLPRSDRFPWDHTKGRYFIKVFHQLHCLVSKISE